jgi:hypothetical protein
VRGVSPQVRASLDSPYVWEYATGVNRQFGSRAAFVPTSSTAITAASTFNAPTRRRGRPLIRARLHRPACEDASYDLTLLENDDNGLLNRQYTGLSLQAQYRAGTRVDFGGNYTISRAWGNVEVRPCQMDRSPRAQAAERRSTAIRNTAASGISRAAICRSTSVIARDCGSMYRPWVSGLTLRVLQALESGVPYSASNQNGAFVNGVDPRPLVANPGYLNPP